MIRVAGTMGKCKNHPDVESSYFCQKQKYYLCLECLQCADPDFYCKYRSSCVIHFLEKEKKNKKKMSSEIG